MSVMTVGDFDGVHLGHQALLDETVRLAKERKTESIVLTFDRNCKSFLRSLSVPYLTDFEEKKELLLSFGITSVAAVSFNEAFSDLSEISFLRYLKQEFDCTDLVGGEDFRFGKHANGFLTDGRTEAGICQHCISLKTDLVKISSSAIRTALADGCVDRAAQWLGRPFTLSGVGVPGNHIGSTIGFPTVNFFLPKGKMLPKNGVYITRTTLCGTDYPSVTNIGCRPTVSQKNVRNVETHILNFDRVLYGESVRVSFLSRLRDEVRFSSMADLSAQLRRDRDTALNWFSR